MADQRAVEVSSLLPGMTDSHFHSRALAARGVDPASLIAQLREHHFGSIIDVAIRPDDLLEPGIGADVADVYQTCGLHPSHTADPDWQEMLQLMESFLSQNSARPRPLVAIGETGLDWFRQYAPRERQLEIFRVHLRLARQADLPVIVHNRDADEDCWQCLFQADLSRGGVMHCFSSSPSWVQKFAALGMYISFAGNVTFKNAEALREAARCVPADRLLLETDAPFLAPHPRRGQTNHPGLIGHTYQAVADARGIPIQELVDLAAENLRTLFRTSE